MATTLPDEDDPLPTDMLAGETHAGRRHSRRLEDKLLIAFHHACDVSDLEVAGRILQILELMLSRRPASPDLSRRRTMEGLVAAHERLWHIRHREN